MSILKLSGKRLPTPFLTYVQISLFTSDFVDGLIYIFLQPSVKKLFVKTFCFWRCCSGHIIQNASEGNISVVERRDIGNDQQRSDLNRSVDVTSNLRSVIMAST